MSTDEQLLSETAALWSMVQEENKAHRKLVTEEEWGQWKRMNKRTTQELAEIIDGFDGTLSRDERTALTELADTVHGAKHMSEDELRERLREKVRANSQQQLEKERSRREAQARANELSRLATLRGDLRRLIGR